MILEYEKQRKVLNDTVQLSKLNAESELEKQRNNETGYELSMISQEVRALKRGMAKKKFGISTLERELRKKEAAIQQIKFSEKQGNLSISMLKDVMK